MKGISQSVIDSGSITSTQAQEVYNGKHRQQHTSFDKVDIWFHVLEQLKKTPYQGRLRGSRICWSLRWSGSHGMTRQSSAHEKWHSVFHSQVDEPPEELRITHRMLDKLLKVTFTHSPLSGWLFSKSFPDVFQISIVWFRFCHIKVLIFSRYREMSLGLIVFLLMTW